MGTFFVYIIKSAICLIAFYLFYKLLLSKDTFHRFNRIALLSLLLLSFVVPLGHISLSHSSEVEQQMVVMEKFVKQAEPVDFVQVTGAVTPTETSNVWILVLIMTYLAGVVFFFSRQLWSLLRMFKLMGSSRKENIGIDATVLVHSKKIAPFSWMKYIIISEKDLEENGKEIITHELAHINRKHSWDLIVADLCIFFQWFNPAAWLLKQEIQSIHEFEADDMVLKQGIDAKQYQLLLIKKAVGTRLYSMANSFNHSSLKKRITMMLKEKSNPWARMKYFYVLPLACVTLLAFARPEVSSAERNSVEKVNDLVALAQAKNTMPENQSADKINENSENNNSGVVKKAENQLLRSFGTLLALNDKPTTSTSNQKTWKSQVQFTPPVITFFKVSGKVICSTSKQPMSSVSVLLVDSKGKSVGGTVTNEDGTFEMEIKSKYNKLRFSCIGFKTIESPVKETMTVQMEEVSLNVDETVVLSNASSVEKKEVKSSDLGKTFIMMEQMPEYPGGEKAMMDYLRQNLKYPSNASIKGKEGRVVCSCVISAEGKVTEVKVVKSVDPDLDNEARRVIENMPDWIPGKQNGKNLSMKFTIPIVFKTIN